RQDLWAVAETRGQRVESGGMTVFAGELAPERGKRAGAGPSPAVDRLARIADGGDGVSATEQRAQQNQLGVTGVLVLVEQDHPVALALGGADLREARGQPGGQLGLIGEVECLVPPLEGSELLDQRHELSARVLDGQR